MTKNSKNYTIICDETNNSQDTVNNKELNVDLYMKFEKVIEIPEDQLFKFLSKFEDGENLN